MCDIVIDKSISIGDVVSGSILFITFIAIIWYSLETRSLRKWQKKQVQISILQMEMNRRINHNHLRKNVPDDYGSIVRDIFEKGKFDVSKILSTTKRPNKFLKCLIILKRLLGKL